MTRRAVSVTCAIFVGVAVLVLAGANTVLPGQNDISNSNPIGDWVGVGVRTHQSRTEELEFPRTSETPAEDEIEIPAPTRSSFMASWPRVNGAIGYRLDVSTSPSFTSYAKGYHDLDVGNVTGRVVTGLDLGTTYYYRARSYDASGSGSYSAMMNATTGATSGFIIHATFDSSITKSPNAVAIEAMINRAISIYESLLSDPVTAQILFRYATTEPNGDPLPAGTLSQSNYLYYAIPWGTYISVLRADAKTANDNSANASLPGTALSTNVNVASACGRALGLNTPPGLGADGSAPGPYDGIVTLNSSKPWQFTRPVSPGAFDGQRSTEHEVDEDLGFASHLGSNSSDLWPQDLFSWSSAGVRNTTSSGTRYFSINGGVMNIVNFSQDSSGDFGDWASAPCPQAHPYVQNAFGCVGQSSDVTTTSPEGINLDVIGYDLAIASSAAAGRAAVTDFNGDGHPDYVLQNLSTRQTAMWYLNNNIFVSSAYGPTITVGWSLRGVADFNRDTQADFALFTPVTNQTAIWYLSGPTFNGSAYGPNLPSGWELVGAADFDGDGYPDAMLYNASTHQTVVWYLNNNVFVSSAYGPTLPAGWSLVGVADFDGDGQKDYALFNSAAHQTAIWYLSGLTFLSSAFGPAVPAGWALVAVADFNGDGKPDYLQYNSGTGQTAIWYLNNSIFVSSAFGPTLPAGWSLAPP